MKIQKDFSLGTDPLTSHSIAFLQAIYIEQSIFDGRTFLIEILQIDIQVQVQIRIQIQF